mgnify:CR=1 FL=1
MSSYTFKTNMLAFSRSLEISEGLLFGSNSKDTEAALVPIRVSQKGVRGQTSNYSTKNPGDVLNAGKSNLQVIEVAALPVECDSLHIKFSLLVVPNARKPQATDDSVTAQSFKAFFEIYSELGGPDELALRYITNIANGRFSWRNKTLSKSEKVIFSSEGTTVVFDPKKMNMASFSYDELEKALISGTSEDIKALHKSFVRGLTQEPQSFGVEWVGEMAHGTDVYPSQEYTRNADKSDISRVLAKVQNGGVLQASMHNQKIGAALRCIDDWHQQAEMFGPIPVNPYGGIQEIGTAVRAAPGSGGLYETIRKPERVMDDLEKGVINNDAHFFAANLIRGGVFGAKG